LLEAWRVWFFDWELPVRITNAKSNQTAFTYGAFGRVTQTNFQSSPSENYACDADLPPKEEKQRFRAY
jgi:YD repeat-containing protein